MKKAAKTKNSKASSSSRTLKKSSGSDIVATIDTTTSTPVIHTTGYVQVPRGTVGEVPVAELAAEFQTLKEAHLRTHESLALMQQALKYIVNYLQKVEQTQSK